MPLHRSTPPDFQPRPADPNGSVTWIHLGDLHMKEAGAQNEIDLGRIVDTINEVYAGRDVSFVYLPGDIADDGSEAAYCAVRSHLDRLALPWCGIVGDHDVHEKSFKNFKRYISAELTSAFTVGGYRFLRLNAFSEPRPDSFVIDEQQLAWVARELESCVQQGQRAVLLLHCYPSDLKKGGSDLAELIQKHDVLLVDMGHTHYNELSNDGHVLYSATRSTGQIEEGPVGFSVVTLDGADVSWHFVRPEAPDLVAITAPADRRLATNRGPRTSSSSELTVHAKVWCREPLARVTTHLNGEAVVLHNTAGTLWAGVLAEQALPGGTRRLTVEATTVSGSKFLSAVEVNSGERTQAEFSPRDQDNAIGAWEERGILGTQLGPNKNGRQW